MVGEVWRVARRCEMMMGREKKGIERMLGWQISEQEREDKRGVKRDLCSGNGVSREGRA